MLDLDFIEACYQPSIDDMPWRSGVAEAAARLLRNAACVMAAAYEVSEGEGLRYGELGGDARYLDNEEQRASTLRRLEHVNAAPERETKLKPFTFPRPSIYAVSELPRAQQLPLRATLPWPAGDILGIFGTLDGTRGFVLGPSGPQSLRPTPRQRRQLERLSEHLAIGHWLRHSFARADTLRECAKLVFHPDGRLLHAAAISPGEQLRSRLTDAVRSLDRARCRRFKHSPDEASELWQGLIDGQYALVETFERDGRRLILGVRCRSPRPRLTPRERAVIEAAARGLNNDLIGAELGMTRGTVATHLSKGLRKLSCPHRRLLPRWLALR